MTKCLRNHRHSEEGSVLLFAVVVILFLATLSLFFKSATTPVFTHHQDARRTLQAEYMMASAENVLKAELLALETWEKPKVKAFLNDYKKIEWVDGQAALGSVRWVKAFNYGAGEYQGFDVIQTPDGRYEVIEFTRPVSYQITLDDHTRAVRTLKLQVVREK